MQSQTKMLLIYVHRQCFCIINCKYKGLLNKGYWNPQRKLGVDVHFSEIISLESGIKIVTSALSCKRRKILISLQIYFEFTFSYRNLTHL